MLNEMQQKAVDSNSKRILALAGAGSGKTHCMLSRIDRLISEGVQPNSILALTFTNVGANELKVRFKKNHGDSLMPEFCTFHGFCYSLISKNPAVRGALGYSAVPNIATPEDEKSIAITVKAMTGTKLSNSVLNLNSDEVSRADKFAYDVYWKQYHKMLRNRGLITFDIMCYEVCKLFLNADSRILSYKLLYKYIFVDEFQDTDPKQWDFVKTFTDSSIYVCGDPKQALYSFRGADSSIIKSVAEDPEWETIELSQNYRSTSEICEFSNAIHENAWKGSRYNLHIHSDKHGKNVIIHNSFNEMSEAELKSKLNYTEDISVAILCRTNMDVDHVKSMLKSAGIPFYSNKQDSNNAYILRSAIDDKFLVSWISSLLPTEEYMRYVRLQSVMPDIMKESEFINHFGDKYGVILHKIMELRKAVIKAANMTREAFITEINTILKVHITVADIESVIDPIEIIGKAASVIEAQTSTSGIYVGTIHSVKGAEFDEVHMYGVNGKSFSVYSGEDNMACYYVGCTRAKSILHIWKE